MSSSPDSPATYFAPAGRDLPSELNRRRLVIEATPLLQETIDAMSDSVVILNNCRQILTANRRLLETLDCHKTEIIGRRPGELLGCRNAPDGPDGCGTARACRACGALNAVLECQATGSSVTRESRILLEDPVGGALDLKTTATRVGIDNETFTIVVLKDISDQKRLQAMARLFFHDVINTAGGIHGYVELLREHVPSDIAGQQEFQELQELADQLIDEITAQRDLVYAESGDLAVRRAPVNVVRVLERLVALYRRHPVGHQRELLLAESYDGWITTDERLLNRILGNMVKNALEATPPGGRVTLRAVEQDTAIAFTVHNPTVMPDEVQWQVFQRSFSTKSEAGHGLGTHSMKLLGERYLGGQVTFVSRLPEGTTFQFRLPKAPPGSSDSRPS